MLAFQLQKRASDLQKKGVYEHFQEISRPPSSTVTLTRFLHFYAPFFGTKGLTNTRYLKTEILAKELSKTISDLFDIRTDCDYDDFFVVSRDEILIQEERAEAFLNAIREYLKTK